MIRIYVQQFFAATLKRVASGDKRAALFLFSNFGVVSLVPGSLKPMTTSTKGRLRRWARNIKRDIHAVYLASRDPRVPWYAKILAALVAAYALSPIDLIPDFVPVLGYLDDLLIVPLGILLVIYLVPPEVMAEHRMTAEKKAPRTVSSRIVAAIIVALWLLVLAWLIRWGLTTFTSEPHL